jgi:hypothetical protein
LLFTLDTNNLSKLFVLFNQTSASTQIYQGVVFSKSKFQFQISNILLKSLVKLLSGVAICLANSTINSVSNSKFTYVVTFIASTNGKENSGILRSIKSVDKYPPLSVKKAI